MSGLPVATRWLLQRHRPDGDQVRRIDEAPRARSGRPHIRCPRCGWEPGPGDRWSCVCGCLWNTFDTRGVCPACDRAWHDTQCPRCNQWSRHEQWYEPGEEPRGSASSGSGVA